MWVSGNTPIRGVPGAWGGRGCTWVAMLTKGFVEGLWMEGGRTLGSIKVMDLPFHPVGMGEVSIAPVWNPVAGFLQEVKSPGCHWCWSIARSAEVLWVETKD